MPNGMMTIDRLNTPPDGFSSDKAATSMESFVLRRHGQRPLNFDGQELAMASSYAAGCANWFEINVFETATHDFVVRVQAYANAADQRDTSDAWRCDDVIQLVDAIEAWDPATVIRIEMPRHQTSRSAGELAAHALLIQARIEEARAQYACLVGELLFELDLK